MHTRIILLTLLILLFCQVAQADPLGTFFTLQGELQQAGVPANGSIEFEFEPFDAPNSGDSLIPPITRTVALQDGIFTTTLDFGDVPFIGEAVWVEVRVRESDGNLVTLSPRQAVTPTPYAIHAQFVGINSVSSLEILDGSVSAVDLSNAAVGQNQINSAQVQRRVSSVCPIGSAIREINTDGSVACQANTADDDWLPVGDGRLENTTGVRVQPLSSPQFPFLIRHDSNISSPTAALVENEQDFARLSFYSDPNASFWTIAAASAANTTENVLNFYNSAVGNIMSVRGNRRVGILNTNPQATLHVSGGDVRVDALAHSDAAPRTLTVQTDGTLVATASELKHLTIGPSEFRMSNGSIDSRIFASVVFPLSTSGTLLAPIKLPDGAVIEEVIMYYRDESSSNDINLLVLSAGLGGNSASVLSNLSSSGSASGYRNVTDSSVGTIINNQSSFYYLNVSGSPSWLGNQEMGIQAVILRYRE